MQLPEAPPPLAPLWDRVLRARALPPDLDVDLLYIAIRDRLAHPEWEVRLHALRVLADLLPLSGNALSFPFDQVVDNLGHGSPNVRKAALDALKVFSNYCEDTECATNAVLDKCSYSNIRPHSANVDNKVNVITGLILSIPSVMAILKRRNPSLDMFPVFNTLGDKLFDSVHRDVALRSLMKLRRVCGPRDYMHCFTRLDPKVQDKFRLLCEKFDEDSLDVFYAPRRTYTTNGSQPLMRINQVFNNHSNAPIRISSDSSSDESYAVPYYTNNYGKVIIETEIKFDSDTAITMTVLEQNETESERNTASDDDNDSIDRNMLKYSDGESEDSDVVVKKVRFGGESVKIRTPDSDNITSEEDNNQSSTTEAVEENRNIEQVLLTTPSIVNKMNDIKRESVEREARANQRKSAIPLPVIQNKTRRANDIGYNNNNSNNNNNAMKSKSKSLTELYDYFNKRTETENVRPRDTSKFALTLTEVQSPEKIPSPVESHKEVEVLHNLQRSPTVSPRRQQTRVHIERDGFVLKLVASSPPESLLVSPRSASPLEKHYDWEDLEIVAPHICDQLHNTENWIAAVKAADQLHNTMLEAESVRRVEPAALSLVDHMWALSDAVPATRAPAEGAVCALVRGASGACIRLLLPSLIARLCRDPPPAALPHALLQRLALHHLIDLIFDPDMTGVRDPREAEAGQLKAALCLARAAGPAAVLAAVRRRPPSTPRPEAFCAQLRERLNKPIENIRPSHLTRSSQLPVPARRARSTPPAAPPPKPRRLRPLPDSAPLPGISQPGRDLIVKPLSPIALSDRDSSALTNSTDVKVTVINEMEPKVVESVDGKGEETEITKNVPPTPSRSPSPSLKIEDYSEKSNPSLHSAETKSDGQPSVVSNEEVKSQKSNAETNPEDDHVSGKTSVASKRKSEPSSPVGNGRLSPDAISGSSSRRSLGERDVRTALAECIMPARHEDWEAIVTGLLETERMAMDTTARAPASSWRAATRSASTHVRSLRSKVARAACTTLSALFEFRGRALDPELEEATGALLERCADVNRFLRADATSALRRIACGGVGARAAVALARRGVTHRAGPVRAAAAQALSALVRHNGASRVLDMAAEPRTMLLRATGELLGDASAEARAHAKHLWAALAEDSRFPQMLKDAMPPTRYRAIEKYVDKLRCR